MEGFNEEFPEVLNSVEQEKQSFVVEKFKEILDEKPQYLRLVIDGHTERERRDDIILYYTQEDSAPPVLHLRQEKRWTEIHAALRGNSPKIYTKEEDANTTIKQLGDIIQTYGEPKHIYYSRLDYDNSEGVCRNDSIAGAFFPFSEIRDDLGLEGE